ERLASVAVSSRRFRAWGTASRSNSSGLATEKIVVLAARARASDVAATSVKPALRRSTRAAKTRSRSSTAGTSSRRYPKTATRPSATRYAHSPSKPQNGGDDGTAGTGYPVRGANGGTNAVGLHPRDPGVRAGHRGDDRGLQHLQRRAPRAAAVPESGPARRGLRHPARMRHVPRVVPEVLRLEDTQHGARGDGRVHARLVRAYRRGGRREGEAALHDGCAQRRVPRAAAARTLVHRGGRSVRRTEGRGARLQVRAAPFQRRSRHRRPPPQVRRRAV